jgi:uncharacterized metal-binding protein YceD (DUF177 family)
VKALHTFDIGLDKLSNKQHEYDFELNDAFFAHFDQNLVNGGNLNVHVTLDKSELLLNFTFHISGTVRLTCDRSLDEFDFPIDTVQTLRVRYGDEEMELDENILQIKHGAQKFNIAQHLFDFIGLQIPIKKLKPEFQKEIDEDDSDDDILIYTSSTEPDNDPDDDDDDEPADPRFAALKKIK